MLRENIKKFLLNGKKLDLNNFDIQEIPYQILEHSIIDLDISNNKRIKLPTLEELPNIEILKCNTIDCEKIPNYSTLKELQCQRNNLYHLPPFERLEKLYCQDNFITVIPTMPNLIELKCMNNPIKRIDFQPKLEILYISTNNITELPLLPKLRKVIVVNFHSFMNHQFLEETCSLRAVVIKQKIRYLKFYINVIKMQRRFRRNQYKKLLKPIIYPIDLIKKIIDYIIL